jgi:hypothetical protein
MVPRFSDSMIIGGCKDNPKGRKHKPELTEQPSSPSGEIAANVLAAT